MAVTGNKRPLETDDLWTLNDQDSSKDIVPIWEHHWKPAVRGTFIWIGGGEIMLFV